MELHKSYQHNNHETSQFLVWVSFFTAWVRMKPSCLLTWFCRGTRSLLTKTLDCWPPFWSRYSCMCGLLCLKGVTLRLSGLSILSARRLKEKSMWPMYFFSKNETTVGILKCGLYILAASVKICLLVQWMVKEVPRDLMKKVRKCWGSASHAWRAF